MQQLCSIYFDHSHFVDTREICWYQTNQAPYIKILLVNNERIGSDDTTVGDDKRKYKARVGKMRIGHSGVAFDVPIQMQLANTGRNTGKLKPQLLPSTEVEVIAWTTWHHRE